MFSVPLPRKVSSLHTTYPIRLISNDTSITPSFLQSSGKTQDVPENHLPIQMWLCPLHRPWDWPYLTLLPRLDADPNYFCELSYWISQILEEEYFRLKSIYPSCTAKTDRYAWQKWTDWSLKGRKQNRVSSPRQKQNRIATPTTAFHGKNHIT